MFIVHSAGCDPRPESAASQPARPGTASVRTPPAGRSRPGSGRSGPRTSDSISFMSFIASTMQTVCPTSTDVAHLDVRIGVRRRRAIERPHHRRRDRDEIARVAARRSRVPARRRREPRRPRAPAASAPASRPPPDRSPCAAMPDRPAARAHLELADPGALDEPDELPQLRRARRPRAAHRASYRPAGDADLTRFGGAGATRRRGGLGIGRIASRWPARARRPSR